MPGCQQRLVGIINIPLEIHRWVLNVRGIDIPSVTNMIKISAFESHVPLSPLFFDGIFSEKLLDVILQLLLTLFRRSQTTKTNSII